MEIKSEKLTLNWADGNVVTGLGDNVAIIESTDDTVSLVVSHPVIYVDVKKHVVAVKGVPFGINSLYIGVDNNAVITSPVKRRKNELFLLQDKDTFKNNNEGVLLTIDEALTNMKEN